MQPYNPAQVKWNGMDCIRQITRVDLIKQETFLIVKQLNAIYKAHINKQSSSVPLLYDCNVII